MKCKVHKMWLPCALGSASGNCVGFREETRFATADGDSVAVHLAIRVGSARRRKAGICYIIYSFLIVKKIVHPVSKIIIFFFLQTDFN